MSSCLACSHYLSSCDTCGTLTCSPCSNPSPSWLAALWGQVSWPFFWGVPSTAAVSFIYSSSPPSPGPVTAGALAAACSHCCQAQTASFLISSDMGQLWSHHLFPFLLLLDQVFHMRQKANPNLIHNQQLFDTTSCVSQVDSALRDALLFTLSLSLLCLFSTIITSGVAQSLHSTRPPRVTRGEHCQNSSMLTRPSRWDFLQFNSTRGRIFQFYAEL